MFRAMLLHRLSVAATFHFSFDKKVMKTSSFYKHPLFADDQDYLSAMHEATQSCLLPSIHCLFPRRKGHQGHDKKDHLVFEDCLNKQSFPLQHDQYIFYLPWHG